MNNNFKQIKHNAIIIPALNNEAQCQIGLYVDTVNLILRDNDKDILRGIGCNIYVLDNNDNNSIINQDDWCFDRKPDDEGNLINRIAEKINSILRYF